MDTIFYTNKDGSLQISKIINDDGHIYATITDEACDECTIIASAPTSAEIIAQLTALRDVLNNIIAANNVNVLPDDPIEQRLIASRPSARQAKPEPTLNINIADWQIDDGYVGSLGHNYKPATPEQVETAIAGAINIMGKTRSEIIEMLNAGRSIKWCKSPNYYYDHSHGVLFKPQKRTVKMIECSCGHLVEENLVMMASLGTSCPDCYDKMSN